MTEERSSGGRLGADRGPWAGVATGYGLGLVVVPIAALPGSATTRDVVTVAVAVLLAAAVATVYDRWVATPALRWVGPALIAVASLMYSVTPAGAATAIIALILGAGVGLGTGGRPQPGTRGMRSLGAVLAAAVVLVAWGVGGIESSLPFVVATLTSVAAVVLAWVSDRGRPVVVTAPAPSEWVRRGLLGVGVVGAAALMVWTGCNDPQLSWFGPVSSHGPRTGNQVAVTFDDGPNDSASLEVARILDRYGVKGTFFEVGRAVRVRSDVSRRLVADGHLVGNHSYHHDYYGWLNPLYPELGATQRVIGRDVGVCPRFFRPPHGQRTPLMNLELARRHMVAVTWDTSAGDWATTDAHLVAKRILDRVRPGSIILLHDSLDGHVDADRGVVVRALPVILDGLERKGLRPVRIDELLGGPAYLPRGDCA